MASARDTSRLRVLGLTAVVSGLSLWSMMSTGCEGGMVDPMVDGGVGAIDGAVGGDAGADGGEDGGAVTDAAIDVDAGPPPPPVPNDIFFVGNSFTFTGSVPTLVRDLAVYAGFEEPNVESRAVGGQTLGFHRADTTPESAALRVAEGWDVVVLQEFSTRPTDSIGDPEAFKEDATWFHDLARGVNPSCRVVLYETWARRAGHPVYPGSYADPADMQAQLRFHYFDAAERYIPEHTALVPDVVVAPAGDAWELQLAMGEPPRLHAADDYHPNAAGAYLNALVLYSTIYGRRATGQRALGVDAAVAAQLQASADAITGETRPPPSVTDATPLALGDAVRVDVGPVFGDGWSALTATMGSTGALVSEMGATTSVVATAFGFDGVQEGGRADNTLGWPGYVSSDSLWVGSFDGHDAALARSATVVMRGLVTDATYEVTLFASRDGDDGGRGRMTRYRIGASTRDLDATDNVMNTAMFEDIHADTIGEVRIEVGVRPDATARFGYVGAIVLRRVD